jgi:hypothetical protein
MTGFFNAKSGGAPKRVSVQELDPVDREREGGEILLHLSLQKMGSHLVQHVAKTVVHFWKRTPTISNGPASPCSSRSSRRRCFFIDRERPLCDTEGARDIGNILF